jgi:hypothetical protein
MAMSHFSGKKMLLKKANIVGVTFEGTDKLWRSMNTATKEQLQISKQPG